MSAGVFIGNSVSQIANGGDGNGQDALENGDGTVAALGIGGGGAYSFFYQGGTTVNAFCILRVVVLFRMNLLNTTSVML